MALPRNPYKLSGLSNTSEEGRRVAIDFAHALAAASEEFGDDSFVDSLLHRAYVRRRPVSKS